MHINRTDAQYDAYVRNTPTDRREALRFFVISVLALCLAVTVCTIGNMLTGRVRLSVALGIGVWLAVQALGAAVL